MCALTFSCAVSRAREGGPLGQRFRSGGAGAELSGRQRHDPIETAGRGDSACSLSDISGWRAGVLYPLAGGGRDSGAAHLDLLGPPGWCSGWWPHDGDVAAGGDFVLAILRFGADDGARAIGATDAAAAVELRGRRRRVCGVLSLRHFRLASWRSLSLGGGGRDSGALAVLLRSGCWRSRPPSSAPPRPKAQAGAARQRSPPSIKPNRNRRRRARTGEKSG